MMRIGIQVASVVGLTGSVLLRRGEIRVRTGAGFLAVLFGETNEWSLYEKDPGQSSSPLIRFQDKANGRDRRRYEGCSRTSSRHRYDGDFRPDGFRRPGYRPGPVLERQAAYADCG